MQINPQYDIVIVGAGMIGASMAASLNQSGLSILLIDKHLPSTPLSQQPDLRVSSLNLGAIRWLKQQGIYQQLDPSRIQTYNALAGYEKGGAHLQFNAADINEDKLGCFVENKHLQQAALKVANCQQLELAITSIKANEQGWDIEFENARQTRTKFIIAADGANSQIKQALNFAQFGWQYRQSCLSVNIEFHSALPKVQQTTTWQTFRPQGPIAFLPLFDNFASLIVYDSADKIKALQQLSETSLKQALAELFKEKITADFDVIQAGAFPLTKRQVNKRYHNQALLVGDAAHTIHPLAGQGVNLGLRDVAAASHTLLNAINAGESWHQADIWQRYNQARVKDDNQTSFAMDSIYKLFSNDLVPVKLFRKFTLNTLDKMSPLKQTALHFALGLNDPYV
ncbi:FAD-dependent monooxygenase [Catenovulum sp. SM1970]|uniref:FAD-dependent monooxygenase n=1 Tax=Marinifaba aquimaris TaxID=2741323 RepID=UPI001572718F|nr:FAD-dependent monooxygenase [Marinifaba aquimaris]NTS78398.1 FAD-dependent monooxygenase [Marinifaba aquimaris]